MNNLIPDTQSNKSKLAIMAVLVLAVVMAFWAFTQTPLNNHECLVSVSARQMLHSGDWVVPNFNSEPRLQKTPLMYWLVAGIASITGSVNEFSARLPSVLLAILSVIAIIYFIKLQQGTRIACLSAAVWASTLGYIKYSQNARPEMALCSFVTIAMLSFYAGMTAENRKRSVIYMLIFWFSFSMSMLAKGPAPLVLVLPPLFCYFLFFNKWKHFRKTMPIIGTILFLIIFLPWPIMVFSRIPWTESFWRREYIDRFLGEYASGHKPFWYYGTIIFTFSVPFSALVPYTLISPFYKIWEKKRPLMLYLWLWVAIQVLVMSISGGKRQHYILSVFPAFSILAGIILNDMIFEMKAFRLKEVKIFSIAHLVVFTAAAAGLIYWACAVQHSMLRQAVHISMMIVIVLGLVTVLFATGRKTTGLVMMFAGYCAIMMAAQVYLIKPVNYNNPSRKFSIQIGQTVPDYDELIAYNYVSARTIQYAGRTIPEISDTNRLYDDYQKGAWIIATGDNYTQLLKDGRYNVVFERKKAERRGSKDVSGALLHKKD